MVIDMKKTIVGIILLLAVVLSYMAFSRIWQNVRVPADPVSKAVTEKGDILKPHERYFSEYRLQRERNRSRQMELLEKLVNNEKLDDKSKERAARELMNVINMAEKERIAEETVKALGYEDCVVLLRDNAALVVIDTVKLSRNDENLLASQLADILKVEKNRVTVMARPADHTTPEE